MFQFKSLNQSVQPKYKYKITSDITCGRDGCSTSHVSSQFCPLSQQFNMWHEIF